MRGNPILGGTTDVRIKRRVYVGLLVASLFLLAGLATGGWYLVTHRSIVVSRIILTAALIAGGIGFIIIGCGILAIVLTIIRCRSIPSFDGMMRAANQLLFPLAVFLGTLVGIGREKVWQSFIAVNNTLVKAKSSLASPSRLLILVPHCLQDSECPHKITADVNNCKKCGKCCIKDLIELAEKYHAVLKVATGGTLARKYISDFRPQAVVAVACERDLSSGIQDAGVLPVLGVLNSRPNGPCFNTKVAIEEVENAIKTIIKI